MFDLSSHDLSEILWKRLLKESAWLAAEAVATVYADSERCEQIRERMANPTGSIPVSTAVWLYLLTRALRPRTTVEIGTFIGKSTLAMAAGMNGGTIWTCDASNDFAVPATTAATKIIGHGRTASTAMLEGLTKPVDLFFFDGRIQDADLPHIARLSHGKTIHAFDDFEGVEKGVSNASLLRTNDTIVIVPPAEDLLKPLGVVDRSTLALRVRLDAFRFSSQ